MSSFKKSHVRVFERRKQLSSEYQYWKKFGEPVLLKEFGPVDYLHFSPIESHHFAATSSARVQIYNSVTRLPFKNLNKFKETAYGGSFRADGKLLCAGSEDCVVRLFDVISRNLLRRFKGHTSAVHRTFFTCDSVNLASFSDDKSVILWDISTEEQVVQYKEHNDYIRAGCVSPVSRNIILSGGYDGQAKMYDVRDKSVVCSLDHGAPIESVLFLPSGSIFITAGGKEIRVWDAFTRNMLTRCSQYHKTVTCMCLSQNGRRLMTGSLDHRVKIIDTISYRVVHTLTYTSPILSIACGEDDKTFLTGTVSGLITIQKRSVAVDEPSKKKVSYRHIGDTLNRSNDGVDTHVFFEKRDNLAKFETALRKFQYSKALDCAMVQEIAFKHPAVVVTVFDELIRRKGLLHAVSERNSKQLALILRFLTRYISEEKFTKVLIEVANCVIDAYCDVIDNYSSEVKKLFEKLFVTLKRDVALTEELLKLQGAMEMIFAAANSANENMIDGKQLTNGKVVDKQAEMIHS